jgi:hypothetical protein
LDIQSKLAQETYLAQHEYVIDGRILTQQVRYSERAGLGFHDLSLAAHQPPDVRFSNAS